MPFIAQERAAANNDECHMTINFLTKYEPTLTRYRGSSLHVSPEESARTLGVFTFLTILNPEGSSHATALWEHRKPKFGNPAHRKH